ncbi:hypothetical protein [Pseudomonas koreensis]|uniref:hypothetical protein n=1 Tax=Pseudomonas koreensis TaxID=198620 RepID=UPI00132FA307|nr:hypothetical protein [Pseudomonas koreensis]
MKRSIIAVGLFSTLLYSVISWSNPAIPPEPLYVPDDMIISSDPEALIPVKKRPITGIRKGLLVIGHWSGEPGLDAGKIAEQTFSAHWNSLSSYVSAASGNRLKLEGTQIAADFGKKPERCSASGSLEAARQAAVAQNIDPAAYHYLLVAVPCGGGAIATMPGNWIWVKGMPGSPHVWKHEFGHNLGYPHGGSFTKCPVSNAIVKAPEACSYISYGDTGDSVSGGGTLYPAINRWFSGWLDDSQASAISKTGFYRLGVLGKEGPQLYLINRPTEPRLIALEYRQPTPFDEFSPTDNRVTGVWIRYSSLNGTVRNVQLDATPETATAADPTLQAGRTLEDATAKVKIKVCATDKSGASVVVAFNGQGLPDCTTAVPPPLLMTPQQNDQTTPRPVFSGTARPGATIKIAEAANPENFFATDVADTQGKWSIIHPARMQAGQKTIVLRQYFGDEASVASEPRSFKVTELVDLQPPIISTPVENSEAGLNPLISGTALPGAHIRVTKVNGPYNVLAETDADAYGKWSVQSEWSLPIGPFSITAWQSIDGKRSPWSANRKITVVDALVAPIIETPTENGQTGQHPMLSGTALPGAHIRVTKVNGPYNVLAETDADAYGKWSVQSEWGLPIGPFSITAWQSIDGKRSPWSANRKITVVDALVAPIIETPTENGQTGQNPMLSGTALPGAHIRVTKVNGPYNVLAETDADAYGKWSVRSEWSLPVGPFSITAWQSIDGKRSPWSTSRKITVTSNP